jgi:hypothetical protein
MRRQLIDSVPCTAIGLLPTKRTGIHPQRGGAVWPPPA